MKSIARVTLPISLDKEFDYCFAADAMAVKKGMRVLVDFRGRKRVGLVTAVSAKSTVTKLKNIIRVLDLRPLLREDQFKFAEKLSQFYPYALGEFLFMLLPSYLRKPHLVNFQIFTPLEEANSNRIPLTGFIKSSNILERYQRWKGLVREKLKQGSVIVCLPQSSYLQRIEQLMKKDFPSQIKVLHSQRSEKEFFAAWASSRKQSLILGMRMALFHYPADLELIIIEEEDSPHYSQEEKPFYHLSEVAMLLSALKGADLVLAGDHPSLITYKHIENRKIKLQEIKSPLKEIELVDLSGFSKKKLVGPVLVELLNRAMKENAQAVILGNKKKTADRISLLKRIFPGLKINSWQDRSADSRIILSNLEILSSLYKQELFDWGFLLDCGDLLSRPDYCATFNTFLYIRKLSSFFRNPLKVFIQSREYYLYDYLNRNWKEFYSKELVLRKKMGLPPFKLLAKITLRASKENLLLKQAQDLYNRFAQDFEEVYGPVQEYPFKLRDKFRYSVTVKTDNNLKQRAIIKAKIDQFRSSKVQLAAELL